MPSKPFHATTDALINDVCKPIDRKVISGVVMSNIVATTDWDDRAMPYRQKKHRPSNYYYGFDFDDMPWAPSLEQFGTNQVYLLNYSHTPESIEVSLPEYFVFKDSDESVRTFTLPGGRLFGPRLGAAQ